MLMLTLGSDSAPRHPAETNECASLSRPSSINSSCIYISVASTESREPRCYADRLRIRNVRIQERVSERELLSNAFLFKYMEAFLGHVQVHAPCVHKQGSRAVAPRSIGSSIWLSTALTSCLAAPAQPLGHSDLPPPRSGLTGRHGGWERERGVPVRPSVCLVVSQLHLRIAVADVHRRARGGSPGCRPHVPPVSLLSVRSSHAWPPLHHENMFSVSASPARAPAAQCVIRLGTCNPANYIRSIWNVPPAVNCGCKTKPRCFHVKKINQ